jgi:type I restriction enzyme S subunit
MPPKWKQVRLGELAEFRNGVNFNSASFGSGIKIIGVSNFHDYIKPRYEELSEINPQGVVSEQNLLQQGDVLFVRSNGNRELIGRSLFIDNLPEPITHSAFTIRVRFLSPNTEPRFFAYFFRTSAIRQALTAHGGGTNISNLNQGLLSSLPVPLPPLVEQRRIAGILSIYDDLIENSERRIRVLDEMARLLYREWFARFRYPGYENVPLVESPIGRSPKGWRIVSATESLQVNPNIQLRREGETPFVPMNSLSTVSMVIADIQTRSVASGSRFQNDDTLMARITPCLENGKTGYVQFLPNDSAIACGSTEFIVLRGGAVPAEFVYCLARSEEFRAHAIKSMSGATGRQRVQEACFRRFLHALPPEHLLKQFTSVVRPSFKLTERLHQRVVNLRKTRDLLLPRLLSGRLSMGSSP